MPVVCERGAVGRYSVSSVSDVCTHIYNQIIDRETLETNKSTAAVNQCAVTSWNSCRRREIWPFLIALFICVSSKNLWWFSTLGLSRCLRFLTSGSSRQSWNQQPEFRKTNEIFYQTLWLQSRHYLWKVISCFPVKNILKTRWIFLRNTVFAEYILN